MVNVVNLLLHSQCLSIVLILESCCYCQKGIGICEYLSLNTELIAHICLQTGPSSLCTLEINSLPP